MHPERKKRWLSLVQFRFLRKSPRFRRKTDTSDAIGRLIILWILGISLVIRAITSTSVPIEREETWLERISEAENRLAETDVLVFKEMKNMLLVPKEIVSEIENLERNADATEKEAQRLWNSIPNGTVIIKSIVPSNNPWEPVFDRVERLHHSAYEMREKAKDKKRSIAQNSGAKLTGTPSVSTWEQREIARAALDNIRFQRPRGWDSIVLSIHYIATFLACIATLLLIASLGGAM